LLLIPTACSQRQTTNHNQSALAAGEISTESIQQTAFSITVKVIVGHGDNSTSGSGVLIARGGNIYTVVTNAHVIGDEQYSFEIKTFDGKTHTAFLKNIKSNQSGQQDLALLQFQATEKYTPASIGDPKQVTPNQSVFTSGFADDEAELTFNSGKIGQISQKPLRGGYQIGFTNTTKQGMSGGTLLNEKGKVVGILGLGAAAILDNAYTYADGSRPDAQMLEKLRANSFAVPIASLTARNDLSTALAITQPAQSSKYKGLLGQVDSIAQQITVRINSKNNGNGSGVIVAHEGDTYYVVTAGHVVTNKDNYTIVAPDGQSYPVENSTIKTSEGTDLAVVQFTSQENYSTATIADYINNPDYREKRFENSIFVSGFPGTQRERELTAGYFAEVGNWAADIAKDSFSLTNGNGLLYTNISLPGMSGGGVLDSQGRLIGINTGAENEYVEAKTGQYEEVALGNSLGIPIKNFLNLAKSVNIPSATLKQDNPIPLELTYLESNSIKEQLFAFKPPGKNATETDWLNYGNQLWRASEDEKAVQAFDRAISLNPQEYRAYYGKGLASYKKNEQIDAFKQATKLNPNFYAAWQKLAGILSFYGMSQIKENLLESLPAYNRAIQLEPRVFTNYVRRGDVLKNLKRYDEAIASYDQSIKLQPYARAYLGKADVYFELENYQSAIDNYNQAKKLDPLLSNDVETNNQIGMAYNELKDYKSAIAILSQTIKQSDDPQSSINRSLYGNRGNVYANLKDYQSALADYNQAIKLGPSVPEPYLNRALLYYDLKDVQKGDRDVEKGIQILKQNLTYNDEPKLKNIAKIFKDERQPEAEQKILGIIAYLKASTYVNQASEMLEQKKDKDREAIKLCTQAITIDPKLRIAYTTRGTIYHSLKEYQLALKDFTKAIEVNPKYAPAYVYRSVIYRELKDYQKALDDSNKAISVNPELAMAYYIRGGIYYRLNQPQKAKNNWRKAAELYDDPSSSGFEQEASLEEKINELQQAAQKNRRENNLESYHSNKAALKQFQAFYYKEKGYDSLYGKLAILSSDGKAVPMDKQKAIEFYTKAIALDARYVDAYVLRGSAYKELKNYPKAIADYSKVISLDPDNTMGETTYFNRGVAYDKLKDYQSASKDFTKAIEICNKDELDTCTKDQPTIAQLHLERSVNYFNLKQYSKALVDLNKVILFEPKNPDAYYWRSANHYNLKLYAQALADANKSISLEPKNPDTYFVRAKVYYFFKDTKKAQENWQIAAKLYKQQGDLQIGIQELQKDAQLYQKQGKVEDYQRVQQAIKVFEQFQ
jgi:tetratricopeptide (TPR) repeat protein/S1-C subfamily serine protease